LAAVAILGATIGIGFAVYVYLMNRLEAEKIEPQILQEAWRFDQQVSKFMDGPGRKIFNTFVWFDKTVIDGTVNGTGRLTQKLGTKMRVIQTGLVRTYALGMAIGSIIVIAYFLTRMNF
jgi:NADH-quinone oxidoreductase subunit L